MPFVLNLRTAKDRDAAFGIYSPIGGNPADRDTSRVTDEEGISIISGKSTSNKRIRNFVTEIEFYSNFNETYATAEQGKTTAVRTRAGRMHPEDISTPLRRLSGQEARVKCAHRYAFFSEKGLLSSRYRWCGVAKFVHGISLQTGLQMARRKKTARKVRISCPRPWHRTRCALAFARRWVGLTNVLRSSEVRAILSSRTLQQVLICILYDWGRLKRNFVQGVCNRKPGLALHREVRSTSAM